MSRPEPRAWRMMKRVARYVISHGRTVQKFAFCNGFDSEEHGYRDSDWAGYRISGKSTSGGTVMVNGHLLKSLATTQQTIALSSGEAELYAMTKTAVRVTGIIYMFQDVGIKLTVFLVTRLLQSVLLSGKALAGRDTFAYNIFGFNRKWQADIRASKKLKARRTWQT